LKVPSKTKCLTMYCSYPSTTPEAIASAMRVVAVSATLPNISDIAAFFDANEAYSFDDSYRPVPLTTHVSGFGKVWKNQFGFWKSLDKEVRGVINHFSQDNKQTLIFCHTKNETQTLACYLLSKRPNDKPALLSLRECLAQGIAFHHAGLEASERRLVEQEFAAGRLRILCATSTLAVGVNLPAHLVVVKGTMTWRGGSAGYQEIDATTLLQMIGRAGRPGLDTSGTAVIMTDNDSKERIRMLASGLGAAESQLVGKLVDVVNTEISQRVITSLDTAINWIKTTLLFQCLKKNPKQFGVQIVSQHSIDSHLLQLCQSAIRQLHEEGLVEVNDDNEIFPLPASHIMSQTMVPFDAMKLFTTLSFDASQKDILSVLSQVEDLCAFSLRRDEKKLLNELHETEKIRHKLGIPASKFRLKTPKDKAFVLLQASIGQHHFTSYSLKQEMSALANNASRFLSAVEAFSIKGSKNGHVAFQSLKLRRSLERSLWGSSSGVLNQIEKVGQISAAKLVFNGIVSFEDVLSSSEERIEHASGRPKPFGKSIRDLVGALMKEKLETSASIEFTRGSNTPAGVVCEVNYCTGVKASSVTRETKLNYTLVSADSYFLLPALSPGSRQHASY
jgi:ATP-dependent DNA helicase HFM1/MER3